VHISVPPRDHNFRGGRYIRLCHLGVYIGQPLMIAGAGFFTGLIPLFDSQLGMLIPGKFESQDPNWISRDLFRSRSRVASSAIVWPSTVHVRCPPNDVLSIAWDAKLCSLTQCVCGLKNFRCVQALVNGSVHAGTDMRHAATECQHSMGECIGCVVSGLWSLR